MLLYYNAIKVGLCLSLFPLTCTVVQSCESHNWHRYIYNILETQKQHNVISYYCDIAMHSCEAVLANVL